MRGEKRQKAASMAYWHMDRATRFGASQGDKDDLRERASQLLLRASECTARDGPHGGNRESEERKARRSSRAPVAPEAQVRTTPRASSVIEEGFASELLRLDKRISELQRANRETAAESRSVCRVM